MSTTGSDSNDGLSSSSAKLTFNDALTAVALRGDKILLEDGIYRIGTNFSRSANEFKNGADITIEGQTTNGTIISGGPLHVNTDIGDDEPYDVIGQHGLFYKYQNELVGFSGKSNPELPMKVLFNNISFISIQQFANAPLFGTVGEDEFTFSNCVFQDIQVAAAGTINISGGFGGFLGKAFNIDADFTATVSPSGWNGRGIFKNTIFKRIWVVNGGTNYAHQGYRSPSPTTASELTGIFQCFGTYLRFANCTINMDHEYKTWHSDPLYSGGNGYASFTNKNYGAALLYASCPGGQWMNQNTQTWSTKSSSTFPAYEAAAGSPSFDTVPVSDVKFYNCHLHATGGATKAGGAINNYAGQRQTIPLSHAYGPYQQVDPYFQRPKTDGNPTEPPTPAAATIATHGYPLNGYWPLSALSGTNINSRGDNIWYNSEFTNCSFNNFENGAGYTRCVPSQNWITLGYCINKFTDCMGSAEFIPNSATADPPNANPAILTDPPTFPTETYTVIRPVSADIDPLWVDESDNAYELRPGSPLISKGTSIPASFYNVDAPSYQPSIYS